MLLRQATEGQRLRAHSVKMLAPDVLLANELIILCTNLGLGEDQNQIFST